MSDFDIGDLIDPDDGSGSGGDFSVVSPAGHTLTVLTQSEKDFYEQKAERYQLDNKFQNVSDLGELDRILTMELMVHRWSQWQITEVDYNGIPVDIANLQRYIENFSKEIRAIKKDLGMDKATRDKDSSSNVADYIHKLGLKAREFGIHRNNQMVQVITDWQELRGKVELSDNSNEAEKREFKCSRDDVWEWMVNDLFPRFEKLDDDFREKQKLWIREL